MHKARLKIDLWGAPEKWGVHLRELGITYKEFEPAPIADAIFLHSCENVPETLPFWLENVTKPLT